MKITAKRFAFGAMLMICIALVLHAPYDGKTEQAAYAQDHMPVLAQMAVK